MLEYFLRQIARSLYLYSSDEVQQFLRGPAGFNKSEIISSLIDYKLISIKYQKVFSQYVSFTRTLQIEKEIGLILGHLNNGICSLEKLAAQCFENDSHLASLDAGINKFMLNIDETREYFGENKEEHNQLVLDENPYHELGLWCRNNILSISGFIDGIYKQYDIQKLKSRVLHKIEEEKAKLAKLKNGEKKIVQFFNKKPSEFYIDLCENDLNSFYDLTRAFDIILNISSALIITQYYPNFKNDKKNDFFEEIKN